VLANASKMFVDDGPMNQGTNSLQIFRKNSDEELSVF
jgi:hypothetical protein